MNKLINSINNINECADSNSALNNFDQFMLSLFENSVTSLVIEVEASESNGAPELQAKLNDKIIFCEQVPSGIHRYKVVLACEYTNTLSLAMTNKQSSDTIVVNDIIVQDKWLKLHKLEINGYNLVTDYDFFNKFFKYQTADSQQAPMSGFWSNAQLTLDFEAPFALWYNRCSKNSQPHKLATRVIGADALAEIEEKLKKSLANLKY